MRIKRFVIGFIGLCYLMLNIEAAQGAIKSEIVEYRDGKTSLEGYMVSDDSWTGPRPTVLIVHQWMGLSDNEKMRAKKLAEQGYLAFAIDIYGKGLRPKNTEEAAKLSSHFKNDIKLYRQREKAALDFILKNNKVDAKKVVFMGYCFGGGGALEAARAGFPIAGAVSFHGTLLTPNPQETKNVKPKIMVFHGAIDPYVPFKDVEAFMKEMNEAKADYQFTAYSGAVHAFTQKESGTDITKGVAYNEVTDRLSWEAFLNFLKEVMK